MFYIVVIERAYVWNVWPQWDVIFEIFFVWILITKGIHRRKYWSMRLMGLQRSKIVLFRLCSQNRNNKDRGSYLLKLYLLKGSFRQSMGIKKFVIFSVIRLNSPFLYYYFYLKRFLLVFLNRADIILVFCCIKIHKSQYRTNKKKIPSNVFFSKRVNQKKPE